MINIIVGALLYFATSFGAAFLYKSGFVVLAVICEVVILVVLALWLWLLFTD